eukprot:scaffold4649_cov55-Phaeocystis_antarctica.AAC.10
MTRTCRGAPRRNTLELLQCKAAGEANSRLNERVSVPQFSPSAAPRVHADGKATRPELREWAGPCGMSRRACSTASFGSTPASPSSSESSGARVPRSNSSPPEPRSG